MIAAVAGFALGDPPSHNIRPGISEGTLPVITIKSPSFSFPQKLSEHLEVLLHGCFWIFFTLVFDQVIAFVIETLQLGQDGEEVNGSPVQQGPSKGFPGNRFQLALFFFSWS